MKTYLGDGVYACYDRGALVLTTENGDGQPIHTIVLEPEVVAALKRYTEEKQR